MITNYNTITYYYDSINISLSGYTLIPLSPHFIDTIFF